MMFRGLLNLTLTMVFVSGTGQAAFGQQEEPPDYPMGALLATEDVLKKIPRTQVYRSFVPPRVDLSRYTPRPGRQKDSSCVGWAVAYAARTHHFAWDNKLSPFQKRNIASPSALYNAAKSKGDCRRGTAIPNALTWLKKHGVPSQAEFPSNKRNQCYRQMDSSSFKRAEKFKIKAYRRVLFDQNVENGVGVTRIRDQLAQRRPVVFGALLPNSFYRPRRGQVYTATTRPPCTAERCPAHAMVIVAYDDYKGGGSFKIQNSWGVKWGDGGYLWQSYRSFVALADEAYVLETRPLKKPRPLTPSPDPVVVKPVVTNLKSAQKFVARYSCAGIETYRTSSTKISFFAKTDKDRKEILGQLKEQLPGVEIVGKTAPWPQCEARLTLQRQLAKPRGLSVALKGHEVRTTEPILKEGDPFVLKIKTPDFPSYLYAAYLQTDASGKHEAVHLIQSVDPLKQYPPNTIITMGDGADGSDKFSVSGPNFGREMLVLLASASTLYTQERPWQELERDYLSGIRDVLIRKNQGKGERLIAAQLLTLTTKSGE